MRSARSCAIVFVVILAAAAYAQQKPVKIQITDASGATVEVANVDFDYSNYPAGGFGLYTPDHERGGIRVRQGTARVTVPWTNITSLTIEAQTWYYVDQKDNAGRLEFAEADKAKWEEARKSAAQSGQWKKYTGRLQLVSGKTSTVEIVPLSKDITGKSDLGDYSISMSAVREMRPVK